MKCDAIGVDLGELQIDHIKSTVYIELPLFNFLKVGSPQEQRDLDLIAFLRLIFTESALH